MQVFLTGATGHVGGAVAEEFLRHGHSVTALVRSAEGAARVRALGADPVIGELCDPESYRREAGASEVLIHTAFEYDANGSEVHATDRAAVDTLLGAARSASPERQVIYTSSAYLLGGAGPVDEDADTAAAPAGSQLRLATERRVLEAGSAYAVVRAGLVYGGRGGTMPWLFGGAEDGRAVEYPGDGRNRWVLVYIRDLAALYRTIAERRAGGIFHGVDGTPLAAREVAEAASRAAFGEARTRSVPPAEGDEHIDRALARDVAVVPRRSLELGWAPRFASFADGAATAFAEWRRG